MWTPACGPANRSWSCELAAAGFKNGLTFTDLGKHLLKVVSKSPTPLGRFYRSWCIPTTHSGHGAHTSEAGRCFAYPSVVGHKGPCWD